MIKYKINVLKNLKDKGYTSYKLRRDRLFGEATIQKIRKSELVSWENINTICNLLDCQPGDILLYERDSK